jgi:DNA-binding transcriptional MerR regulator
MEIYTTSQVAEKVGVTKKTLYSWLKKGVIPEPDRDYKNHRIWTKEDIQNCRRYKNTRIPGGVSRAVNKK